MRLTNFKTAQVIPLTLNSLEQLRRSMLSPDTPGQQYLMEGPEVAELRNLRAIKPGVISKVEEYMHQMFMALENNLDDVVDHDPTTGELNEEIDVFLDSGYLSDMVGNMRDDDWLHFLKYINDIESHFDSEATMLSDFLANWREEEYNKLYKKDRTRIKGLPSEEEFQDLITELQEYKNLVEKEEIKISGSIDDIVNEYNIAQTKNQEKELEQFWRSFANMYAQIISEIIENELGSLSRRRWMPSLPDWVNSVEFRNSCSDKDIDLIAEWYKDYHSDSLRREAEESLSERDWESLKEFKEECKHRYGTDPFELFGKTEIKVKRPGDSYTTTQKLDYDPEDTDDRRRDLPIGQIFLMLSELQGNIIGYLISSAPKTANIAAMYLQAIKKVINTDPVAKSVFSNDLNQVTISAESLSAGIESALEEGNIPIPEEFADMAANFDQNRLEIERLHQQEEEQLNEMHNKMFYPETKHVDNQTLLKMKELGIANRPFAHDYRFQRGSYPGHGVSKMPENLQPFTLSIAPTEESIRNKIPSAALENLGLHSTKSPYDMPSLGWVGGYGDYDNKILYVTEIQSDIMQRSGLIRDPAKNKKRLEEEITQIQQEIASVTRQLDNPVQNPRTRMESTIARIESEQNKLGPESQQYKKNDSMLQQLRSQLSRIPQWRDNSSALRDNLASLQNKLIDSQQRLKSESTKGDDALYTRFNKEHLPSYWHDYKSKIENTFKDWIKVFFNALLREAKQRGFNAVRLITSSELLKMWGNWISPETKILFERIYDRLASSYNAKPVNDLGKTWYEIDILDSNLRVANRKNNMKQNWLNKEIHKFSDHFAQTWKENLKTFVDHMLVAGHPIEIAYSYWLSTVPASFKQGDNLVPELAQQVKDFLLRNYSFNPDTGQEGNNFDASDPKIAFLDNLLSEYQYFNTSLQTVVNHWLARLSPADRQNKKLLDNARRLLIEKYNYDPLENEGEEPVFSTAPPVLTLHLDMFFESLLLESPELRGPEFASEGYEADEGKQEIFRRWLSQLSPRIKDGEDLKQEFKQPIRQYVIQRWKFDPYSQEDMSKQNEPEDTSIPTPEELDSQWGTP